MAKEYFWDEQGIAQKNDATLTLIKGQKEALPVMDVGTLGTPDEYRIENPYMYYDKDGSVFGVAGRLHCWYSGFQFLSEAYPDINYYSSICYAYSNDMGASFTRPSLGICEYPVGSGNANNNIIYFSGINMAGIGWVFVTPEDTQFPLKAIVNTSTNTNKYYFRGASATDLQQVSENVVYEGTDFGSVFSYKPGKVGLFNQLFWWDEQDPTNTMIVKRLFCADTADITEEGLSLFLYGSVSSYTYNTNIPRNKSALDYSNITPQEMTYMGEYLMTGEDLYGEFLLVSPNMYTKHGGDYLTGNFNPGLGLFRNFPNDDVMQRIRGNTDDTIVDLGAIDSWDMGLISMADQPIETDTQIIGFYTGYNVWHEDAAMSYHRERMGKVTWRKDGYTKFDILPNGFIKTSPLPYGGIIKANHIGQLKVEEVSTEGITVKEITISGDSVETYVFTASEGNGLRFTNTGATTSELYSYSVDSILCSATVEIKTANGIESIPVYTLDQITNNGVHIFYNGQTYYINLVNVDDLKASSTRIYIGGAVMALAKT